MPVDGLNPLRDRIESAKNVVGERHGRPETTQTITPARDDPLRPGRSVWTTSRPAGTAAVALLVVGLLTGCTPIPRPADVAGAWRDENGTVRLRLAADGGCSARDLETEQGPVTGGCRWTVGSASEGARASDGAPLIQLDFSADLDAGVSQVDFGLRDGGNELSFRNLATDMTVALHR